MVKVANAFDSEAESNSVYRQIQRFLKNENEVSIDCLKLLKLDGKLLMLLGLGLSLAMLMGEFQVEITCQVKMKLKKNQKIWQEFIPNRVRRIAKCFIQLP